MEKENTQKEKLKIYNRLYYRKYYYENRARILEQIKTRKEKKENIKPISISWGKFEIIL